MKVVVLAAGTSSERDVSIVSGTGVAKALKTKGHKVFFLDVFYGCSDEEAESAFESEQDVDKAAQKMKADSADVASDVKTRKAFFGPNVIDICQKADKVFLALHGANGEDGKVQAAFDLFGIPYTGCGPLESGIAMDKGITKIMFNHFNISTPEGYVVSKSDANEMQTASKISYPVIVKPLCGGSSVGVFVVNSDDEFKAAVAEAFSWEDYVVVEEFIKGREFSVGVIEGKAFPVIEIVVDDGGFYDYEHKYNGKTKEICPAPIDEETTFRMQEAAVAAAKALMLKSYSRLDFLMDKNGRLYCLEANTLPGMTPTSLVPQEAAVLGISFEDLCEKLLNL